MLLCGYDSGRPLPDKFPLQNICNVRVQYENTYPSALILVEFKDLKTHEQVDPTLFKESWAASVVNTNSLSTGIFSPWLEDSHPAVWDT